MRWHACERAQSVGVEVDECWTRERVRGETGETGWVVRNEVGAGALDGRGIFVD